MMLRLILIISIFSLSISESIGLELLLRHRWHRFWKCSPQLPLGRVQVQRQSCCRAVSSPLADSAVLSCLHYLDRLRLSPDALLSLGPILL